MPVFDVVEARGHLFLGSRLKRLAERMQADVVRIAQDAGLTIQPAQYPILATLDAQGPRTIAELTQALQLSQPTITRTVARLREEGLVEVSRERRDQRHKTVSLTAAGQEAMATSKRRVWPQVEAAVHELIDGLDGPLLDQIGHIERALSVRPLHARGRPSAERPELSIRPFSDDLAADFKAINLQWIDAMYAVEAADREVLDDPRGTIIAPGGGILFVEAAGLGVVGACALRKTGDRQFELTKMGVLESARGLKAGEFLLRATINHAQELGAELLYLLSNRKSEAAIYLYEKLGFRHDAGIMRAFGAHYARCDVAMRYAPGAAA